MDAQDKPLLRLQVQYISTYMNDGKGLGTRLRHLVAALDGDVQRIYQELGVPFRPRFYPVVQSLLSRGESSVTALAEETGVTQPAATQTIGEMVKLGLLTLSTADDRRSRRVVLTAEGRRMAQTLAPLWEAVRRAAAELDDELAHPLSDTIDAALAALRQRPFHERISERMNNA